ncbi:MAG TPA: hypothetical protein VLL98_05985 [Rickettsiales bacterium]|nr:hypothetical protein [Rickettsiales bacterium]
MQEIFDRKWTDKVQEKPNEFAFELLEHFMVSPSSSVLYTTFRFSTREGSIEKPDELNLESLNLVKRFIEDSQLKDIVFFGGALINNILREDKSVDDYDLMIIGEINRQRFEEAERKLVQSGYEIIGGHEETTTNLAMRQFKKEDKIFELCLKKDTVTIDSFGTFDVDNISVLIDGEKVYINSILAIQSLRNKTMQLKEQTNNIFRILGRMLVHIAKYGTEKFYLNDEHSILFTVSSEIETKKENEGVFIYFKEQPKQAKAECLAKFLFMMSRVNNIEDYVKKINNSGLLDKHFPILSRILNDKNFLSFLKIESQKPITERTLNTDVNVFDKICQYCHTDDKKDFIKECEILSLARSTKQSPIVKKLESLTCKESWLE